MQSDEEKKRGRPTIYSDDLADIICERLASGESMRSISRDDEMPSMSIMFKWLREKENFLQQYEKAKEESADALVEDMLDIADNQVEQPLIVDGIPLQVDGKIVTVKDGPSVQHARLRVDTRKWAASKLKPKKYGERVTTENYHKHDFTDLSDDDLARKKQELERQLEKSKRD